MGKPTGFMEYKREDAPAYSVKERIKNFDEFHDPLSKEDQQKQGARCMDCGVPFCQAGMQIGSAFSSTVDTDNDGMNDWQEVQLAALGFNWQVNNAALVNTYFSTASLNGLYTESQIHTMNVNTPLTMFIAGRPRSVPPQGSPISVYKSTSG